MRDPNRINRIIEHLRAFWLTNPDMRLGQLLFNLTVKKDHLDIFYVEDDTIERRLVQKLYTKDGDRRD